MAGEVQTIKIGGIEYDKNEVANQTSVTKERTNSKGVWEQYKEYEIASKESYDEIQIKIYQSLIVSIVYSGFGLWIGFAYDVF
jgi:hypothetical protein